MLVNTLTANYQYSVSNTENLSLPIKTEVSLKLTTFIEILMALMESTLNLEHFQNRKQAT